MILAKDSFVKGLMTGLRLGRPPSRQPPLPADLFILDETGEYLLDERRGKSISFLDGTGEITLPVTTIDYNTNPYNQLWVAYAEDVPSAEYALHCGEYVSADTGKVLRITMGGGNVYVYMEDICNIGMYAYTDDPMFYFFHCTASPVEYALLQFRPGEGQTAQFPTHFGQAAFDNFFFTGDSTAFCMITER